MPPETRSGAVVSAIFTVSTFSALAFPAASRAVIVIFCVPRSVSAKVIEVSPEADSTTPAALEMTYFATPVSSVATQERPTR